MRPRYFREVTLAMAVLNLTGFVFVDFANMPGTSGFCVAAMAIAYAALWYFWNGHNWARRLVLAVSLIALLNLLALSQLSGVQRLVVLVEAPLGAFLLYWLNRRDVRSYFASPVETCA